MDIKHGAIVAIVGNCESTEQWAVKWVDIAMSWDLCISGVVTVTCMDTHVHPSVHTHNSSEQLWKQHLGIKCPTLPPSFSLHPFPSSSSSSLFSSSFPSLAPSLLPSLSSSPLLCLLHRVTSTDLIIFWKVRSNRAMKAYLLGNLQCNTVWVWVSPVGGGTCATGSICLWMPLWAVESTTKGVKINMTLPCHTTVECLCLNPGDFNTVLHVYQRTGDSQSLKGTEILSFQVENLYARICHRCTCWDLVSFDEHHRKQLSRRNKYLVVSNTQRGNSGGHSCVETRSE